MANEEEGKGSFPSFFERMIGMADLIKQVRKRKKAPLAAVIGITVVTTMMVLLGAVVLLLGRHGIAVMEGWVLARWAFVETDPDLQYVSDCALEGMVNALGDRWSYYADKASYEELKADRLNQYVGIGVTVDYRDERGIYVIAVTRNSPAELAGIKTGEIIVEVDGVSAAGEARYETVKLIAGKIGDERKLVILGEDGEAREIKLTLSSIPVEVAEGELLENGVGVVSLKNFNNNAATEFKRVTDELVEQGANALIFDVRGNFGGYVAELTEILDYLLPEGIVFQKNPRWGRIEKRESDESCIDLPFAVLVDENSYSAAEIFAAQLRETMGAPIVGELTSGKGYSQNTFALLNGGAIGISTSAYFTGGGVSLIGTGITPDTVISLTEEQEALRNAGTLAREEDPQLQEAIRLLKE